MASSSLAVRETILGVLEARCLNGSDNNRVIHSSDFRAAVSDLGFHMGSQPVADILVHCRVNPEDGNIDFSELYNELARERRLNLKIPAQPKPVPSSRGVEPQPWRADVMHKEKRQADQQGRIIEEYRKEVHDIFRKFVHNDYTVENVIDSLTRLNIVPTRSFLGLLNKNRSSSEFVQFSDFTRTLITYDPSDAPDRPAGAPHHSLRPSQLTIPECDIGLLPSRKRMDFGIVNDQRQNSQEATRKGRKLFMEVDDNGLQHCKLKSSEQVKQANFSDKSNVSLMSHSQNEAQTGVLGEVIPLKYNSEQKLHREQVMVRDSQLMHNLPLSLLC